LAAALGIVGHRMTPHVKHLYELIKRSPPITDPQVLANTAKNIRDLIGDKTAKGVKHVHKLFKDVIDNPHMHHVVAKLQDGVKSMPGHVQRELEFSGHGLVSHMQRHKKKFTKAAKISAGVLGLAALLLGGPKMAASAKQALHAVRNHPRVGELLGNARRLAQHTLEKGKFAVQAARHKIGRPPVRSHPQSVEMQPIVSMYKKNV
jgi:hypothetical protein